MRTASDPENIAAAKEYVDKQLEIMKRYDPALKLSKKKYQHLVVETAKASSLKNLSKQEYRHLVAAVRKALKLR